MSPTDEGFATRLELPSEVFASKDEEPIGLLNRSIEARGPRPDLDEDIIDVLEALEASEEEDILADDFVVVANQGASDQDGTCGSEDSCLTEEEFGSDNCSSYEESDDDFDRCTMGTNFSMSSSALFRNKELQLLDERFDKVMEEYDDSDIGSLEGDDGAREGTVDLEALDDFISADLRKSVNAAASLNPLNDGAAREYALIRDSAESDEEISVSESDKSDGWDCESILSM